MKKAAPQTLKMVTSCLSAVALALVVLFGPTAPKGKEQNWIPTNPGEGWFQYFRLYGPLKGLFRPELDTAQHRKGEIILSSASG
jgi:hypothetical protein